MKDLETLDWVVTPMVLYRDSDTDDGDEPNADDEPGEGEDGDASEGDDTGQDAGDDTGDLGEEDEELLELLDQFNIDNPDEFSPKRALRTLLNQRHNERKQEATIESLRDEKSDLEDQLEAAQSDESEQVSDLRSRAEDAESRVEELEGELASQEMRHAVELAALQAGARDPLDIYSQPLVQEQVEYDDGEIVGVDDVMDELRESKPYLFGENKPSKPDLEGDEGGDGSGGDEREVDEQEYARRFNI